MGVPPKAMCPMRRSWQCNAFVLAAASADKTLIYQKKSNITRYVVGSVTKMKKKWESGLEITKSF
jgi:hypothetical protein